MEGKRQSKALTIVCALVLTFGFHVAFVCLSYILLRAILPLQDHPLAGLEYVLPSFLLGLSQLIYMLPAVRIARRRGAHGTAVGFEIGIVLTVLLNLLFLVYLFLPF